VLPKPSCKSCQLTHPLPTPWSCQLPHHLPPCAARYVRNIEAMGLAPRFFEFLSLEHANNNVHNIRLCRQIIAAGAMSGPQLLQMQVAERVRGVRAVLHDAISLVAAPPSPAACVPAPLSTYLAHT
jgi:hypothetical protein